LNDLLTGVDGQNQQIRPEKFKIWKNFKNFERLKVLKNLEKF